MKDQQLYWWVCWTSDKWKSPFAPILPLSSSSLRHLPRLGGAFGSAWPGVRVWSRRIRASSPNFNMFTEPSVCMCMFSLDPCVQVLCPPACVCVCMRAVCRQGGGPGGTDGSWSALVWCSLAAKDQAKTVRALCTSFSPARHAKTTDLSVFYR